MAKALNHIIGRHLGQLPGNIVHIINHRGADCRQPRAVHGSAQSGDDDANCYHGGRLRGIDADYAEDGL